MKRLFAVSVMVLSLCGITFAAVVHKAPSGPKAGTAHETELKIQGKVVSVSTTELVVNTAEGKNVNFSLNSTTKKPKDLKKDESVTVFYRVEAGKNWASKIEAKLNTPS